MINTVTLDLEQAARILHQLTICHYLIRDGGNPVRAELHTTLSTDAQAADINDFIDQLAHTRRYLDARLATHRRHHTNNTPTQTGWGQNTPAQWGQISLTFPAIYAKVDQAALRPLARPWPGDAA